nr:amino acid permease [uncultured Oribacterium sp.]
MAAVTKDPKKTIPIGIIIITVLLAIVYGLMAYVAAGVLPYGEIAGANLSVTAEAIFPTSLYLFFVVGGGIGAIASSMLGGLAMFRYPLLHIAEDGWLPAVFKKTTKSGYPYLSYLVFYVVGVIPILTGMKLDSAVSLVMIPSMLINLYVNLACLKLPTKYPMQWEKRSIKMSKGFYSLCCVLGSTLCRCCSV